MAYTTFQETNPYSVKKRKAEPRLDSYIINLQVVLQQWPRGPMVRRLTTNQEIACSNPAVVTEFFFFLNTIRTTTILTKLISSYSTWKIDATFWVTMLVITENEEATF